MTSVFGEINNKKVIQLYSLSLFNSNETKTFLLLLSIT